MSSLLDDCADASADDPCQRTVDGVTENGTCRAVECGDSMSGVSTKLACWRPVAAASAVGPGQADASTQRSASEEGTRAEASGCHASPAGAGRLGLAVVASIAAALVSRRHRRR